MTQPEEWQGFEPDVGSETSVPGPLAPVLATFLVLLVVGGTIDLLLDRPASWLSLHVAFEVAMVLVSLGFAVALFRGWRRTAMKLAGTQASLVASQRTLVEQTAERDAWRQRAEGAIGNLSVAIDQQFDAWRLTPAEREVALLLLKGEGHKQAAARLQRSERTVRQHAVEVYRKSGLQGRAELAASFLQDLGLPRERA